VREYRYAYGAIEPLTGDSFFLILPWANTVCMNLFLAELSNAFPEDMILLAVDQASWHTTQQLSIPDNIQLYFLLPCTPEMNPIEQIWKEIRKRGFHNELFQSLNKVIDRLCDTIVSLSPDVIKSISLRDWIDSCV
jgi:putative transposase